MLQLAQRQEKRCRRAGTSAARPPPSTEPRQFIQSEPPEVVDGASLTQTPHSRFQAFQSFSRFFYKMQITLEGSMQPTLRLHPSVLKGKCVSSSLYSFLNIGSRWRWGDTVSRRSGKRGTGGAPHQTHIHIHIASSYFTQSNPTNIGQLVL